MAGPFRERVRLLLAKIETTSGVDAAPVGTVDAVPTVGMPLVRVGYLETGLRDDVQTGLLISSPRAQPTGRMATFDVTIEVSGPKGFIAYDGTVAGSPLADVFLRIAGMGRTIVASTSILYSTLDTGMETATCWLYTANKLVKMVGCVATCRLASDAGKRGLFTFTVTGVVTADPTESALPSMALSPVVPPLFQSASVSIGSWTSATVGDPLVLKHAEIDLGNTIAARDSAGAVDGIVGYLVTDRKTRQTLTVEVPATSTFDAYALSKAASGSFPVSAYQFGTATLGRMKVRTGGWALEAPTLGAASAIMTYQLAGNLTNQPSGAPTSGREVEFLFD